MSLTLSDVQRIANLARLELSAAEADATLTKLNAVMTLIERMQQVDTHGVAPVTSAAELSGATGLPLRIDQVTEHDQRALAQRSAPAVEDGLYLVPRVVE